MTSGSWTRLGQNYHKLKNDVASCTNAFISKMLQKWLHGTTDLLFYSPQVVSNSVPLHVACAHVFTKITLSCINRGSIPQSKISHRMNINKKYRSWQLLIYLHLYAFWTLLCFFLLLPTLLELSWLEINLRTHSESISVGPDNTQNTIVACVLKWPSFPQRKIPPRARKLVCSH